MTMQDPRLLAEITAHPYPLLFATVSGAHLYGFPSPDSDCDLRGVHLLPLERMVGLGRPEETIQRANLRDGLQVDLVTHDAKKFFRMLLERNGYVLEQLYSPLVVHTTPGHEELKRIARGCITRRHALHYQGFARNQWVLLERETPRRVKPLLYLYRVLLTGIHLMRTGELEANLVRLNERFRLSHVSELIERKLAGPEGSILHESDLGVHEREYRRLYRELEESARSSRLPERPTARSALEGLLVRLRLPARDRTP